MSGRFAWARWGRCLKVDPPEHFVKLSGKLFGQAYKSTEQSVEQILAVAKKYGATIALDGWSDALRRPILNFMLSTLGAAVL